MDNSAELLRAKVASIVESSNYILTPETVKSLEEIYGKWYQKNMRKDFAIEGFEPIIEEYAKVKGVRSSVCILTPEAKSAALVIHKDVPKIVALLK